MQRHKQTSMNLAPCVPKTQAREDDARWLDVSDIATGAGFKAGFKTKVSVSHTLSDALELVSTEEDGDYDQRLFDALWLAQFKLSLDQSPSATFNFTFPHKHWKTEEITQVSLRLRVEVDGQTTFVGLLEDF